VSEDFGLMRIATAFRAVAMGAVALRGGRARRPCGGGFERGARWGRRRLLAMPARRGVPLVAVVLGMFCCVGAAQADSLVFAKPDGNIWLAHADGSGQYQVTLDGTPGNPYSDPSEASDGTIEAIHGKGTGAQIVRMTQNGTLLNAPFTTAVPQTGPLDAVLSPDGGKVAYWGVVPVSGCFLGCLGTARTTQISYADHYVDPSTFAPGYGGWSSVGNPAWLSNTRVMLFSNSGTVWYYDLSNGNDYLQWFDDSYTNNWNGGCPGGSCSVTFEEGAASQNGTRLAIVIANSNPAYQNPPGTPEYEIALFAANPGDLSSTTPPPPPTLSNCLVRPPDGSQGAVGGSYPGSGALFDSVSWSPDGSWLSYEYNGTIYTANVLSLTDCTQDSIYQALSGSDPSWSSANVNPAPRPTGAAGPTGPGVSGSHGGSSGPTTGTTIGSVAVPCSGLVGASLQSCQAGQRYAQQLAACNHTYASKSKTARAKNTTCRRTASTAYHRQLALIKCQRVKNTRTRATCVAQARRTT
jgi:hypothetical protein